MTPAETALYNTAVRLLGLHLTLNRAVPIDVGCAEAVSTVLLNAGYPIPKGGIQNVNGLIEWMGQHGFKEIQVARPGCVVTAHNPNPGVTSGAHIGIGLKYGIASNNSNTGIFNEHYSYEAWDMFFGKQGSVTRYFKP